MPPILAGSSSRIVARSAPSGLITPSEIQQALSDALLAFSPLGLLVGAQSARTLSQTCTNAKQFFVACMAPIGTLGMMTTVCKGSKLSGLKEMLGVADDDINDAACDLGCGVLFGLAVPRMLKGGGLTSAGKDANRGSAACAIVRLEWKTGQKSLDLAALRSVVETFSGGTMTGRLVWDVDSQADMLKRVEQVRTAMLSAYNHTWDATLRRGNGRTSLAGSFHALETNSVVIYLFGGALAASFLTIGGLAASSVLSWQYYPSVVLLLGGQLILALGHVAAQHIIKHQRVTLHVKIPTTGLGQEWILVDNTWFTSSLARWTYSFQPLSHHISLGQHHSFKQPYVSTLHALLTLVALASGFLAFYVGGKSSDVKTVVVYIGLFFLANLMKGKAVRNANKPYHTHLNNFGYQNVVTIRDKGKHPKKGKDVKVKETGEDEKEHNNEGSVLPPLADPLYIPLPPSVADAESTHSNLEAHAPSSFSLQCGPQREPALIPLPGPSSIMDTDTSSPGPGHHPSGPSTVASTYRVYAKFALRDINAIGMFYYSSAQEWALAAHAIYLAVQPHVRQWGVPLHREPFLEMPVVFTDDDPKVGMVSVHSVIVIAIDETRHEDTFWNAGMEVTSVLMSNFTNVQNICSESPKATIPSHLAGFVHACVRMLLMSELGFTGSNGLGAQSLMRSIDLVRAKYPHDDSRWLAKPLVDVAQNAAAGVLVPDRTWTETA